MRGLRARRGFVTILCSNGPFPPSPLPLPPPFQRRPPWLGAAGNFLKFNTSRWPKNGLLGPILLKLQVYFHLKFNVFAQRLIEFCPKIKLCHFCNSWNPNFCQNFRKSNEQIEYLQTWKFSPTDLRFFYWPMGNFHRLRPVSGSYIHPCTLSLYFLPTSHS